MSSRLYQGTVWHARRDPQYGFQYRLWYLCLDLAERESVFRRLRTMNRNRHNLLSFWDRDYLGLTSQPVAVDPDLTTELLTVPRFLGHAFNPVSFFLQRRAGRIERVQAEVHNTWHERHLYDLENHAPGNSYRSETRKAFYVSPFLPSQAHYGFRLTEDEAGHLRISIDEYDEQGTQIFTSGIDIAPLTLSDANLLRLLLQVPLVGLKTVAMIHWQGLKLWRRGVSFQPNPSRIKGRSRVWPKGH